MFADELKFFHQILNTNDTEIMQDDLQILHGSSKKLLLSFHTDTIPSIDTISGSLMGVGPAPT